jgi:putative membrane protein
MGVFRYLFRVGWRLIAVWLIDTVSLLVTTAVVPGLSITPQGDTPYLAVVAAAALILGIVNLLIRPLILLMALPFGFFVIFGVGFLVNAIVLMITGAVLPGLTVGGLIPAIIGGILLGAVNAVITSILDIDDSSFYNGLAQQLARRQRTAAEMEPGRGLLMLEVDGLSYWHFQKAMEQGKLPMLKKLMKERGFQLTRIDCGLPSQTSACQAGIMFGDNADIPSFR